MLLKRGAPILTALSLSLTLAFGAMAAMPAGARAESDGGIVEFCRVVFIPSVQQVEGFSISLGGCVEMLRSDARGAALAASACQNAVVQDFLAELTGREVGSVGECLQAIKSLS